MNAMHTMPCGKCTLEFDSLNLRSHDVDYFDFALLCPSPVATVVYTLYSHVILPKELAKTLPKSRLLSESEWRGIGVQQSRGWQHYAIHR